MWWPDEGTAGILGESEIPLGGRSRKSAGSWITEHPVEKENQPRARIVYGKNQQVVELFKTASSENASRLLEIKKNSKHKL